MTTRSLYTLTEHLDVANMPSSELRLTLAALNTLPLLPTIRKLRAKVVREISARGEQSNGAKAYKVA
jgi:hypothetical protein